MNTLNLKTIATMAAALLASSAWATSATNDQKCGAGTCGKKEMGCKSDAKCESSCSKAESSCSKKEASCAKKEASCAKKN